jgi:hypothetical protein
MEKSGFLIPRPDIEQEAMQHGMRVFFTSLIPNNPMENPRQSTINLIKYSAFAVIHTSTRGVLLPVQIAAEVALKIQTLHSTDTSKMSMNEYAEFIAEQLADITYQIAANRLMQKAKDLKIPEGFVRMTRNMLRGNDSQVVLADGGTASISPEQLAEDANVLARNSNKASSTGKSEVSAPVGAAGGEKVKWASHYPKHRPPKNVSWKDIIKSTKHDAAKYKPGIDIKQLELHAWEQGQKVTIPGKNWKVFKCDKVIGANSGKETCFMRVECSVNVIHGHPILEKDYLRYLK